jgi:hypothetical protein
MDRAIGPEGGSRSCTKKNEFFKWFDTILLSGEAGLGAWNYEKMVIPGWPQAAGQST